MLGHRIAMRRFPRAENPPRVVNVLSDGISFARLLDVERFNDFTIRTPGGELRASSPVLAMSSSVVFSKLSRRPPEYEVSLPYEGDYEELIRGLYGEPLVITSKNCRFLHAVGSVLGIRLLVHTAGCQLYEFLTDDLVIAVSTSCVEEGLDVGYIVEYIARRVGETRAALAAQLPIQVVLEVARHPSIRLLPKDDVVQIFRPFLGKTFPESGKFDLNHISFVDNAQLDLALSYNRRMLVDYLDHDRPQNTSAHQPQNERGPQAPPPPAGRPPSQARPPNRFLFDRSSLGRVPMTNPAF
jgi:hypothetical protein